MPYYEPHHASRARIVDLEILRLELRAAIHAKPLSRQDERGVCARDRRPGGAAPPRHA